MDNLLAGIGLSSSLGRGKPYQRLSSVASSCLLDSGGILDRHSGPILATCSGPPPKSGQLRTGINGQLPPEWVANFIPESVSTLLRNTQGSIGSEEIEGFKAENGPSRHGNMYGIERLFR